MERVERKVLKLFGHVERIGEKDWVRHCIGQLWEVMGGEEDRKEDGGMK